MDSKDSCDFSRFGLPPQGVASSVVRASVVVFIGFEECVPLVVPLGSLESVVKMAFSAGMSVLIDSRYNPDYCIWKNEIQGILKSDD